MEGFYPDKKKKFSTGENSGSLHFFNQLGTTALSSLGEARGLRENMGRLLYASLASGTWSKYKSGWKTFDGYESWLGKRLQWPLEKEVLRGFAVYCITVKKLKPASVKTYLSSLACLHNLKGFTDYELKDCLVNAILKGAGNLIMSSPTPQPNTRRVMSLPLLKHLGHRLRQSGWSKITQQTVWTAAVLAFFGSTRMGEILVQAENWFDPSATLTWKCVKFRPDSNSFLIHIRLPKSGTPEGEFIDLFPFPASGCCPVAALRKQFTRQQECGRGKPEDPVFIYPSGKFLTPAGFNSTLRTLLADICDFQRDSISGHSFRAAVPSALSRFPDLMSSDDVKGWGRWSSECYQRYTRLKIEQKQQIFQKIINVFQ